MLAISKKSSLTISELKKRLKHKINWVAFFVVGFMGWMAFSWGNTNVVMLISVCLAIYLFALGMLLTLYRKMADHIDPSQDTLTTMKNSLATMKKVLFREKLFGFFTFPIAIIVGLLVPKMYKGIALMDALADTKFVVLMLVLLIVVVPLMHLMGEKMNKIAYGEFMDELDSNIRKMEEIGG